MALFHVSHTPWLRPVGMRTFYIHFSNISWTPRVLDPITNPFLGPSSWLHPASSGDLQGRTTVLARLMECQIWHPPAGSVALRVRVQKRDNGLCPPFCLGESCPPALALMPDTSIQYLPLCHCCISSRYLGAGAQK